MNLFTKFHDSLRNYLFDNKDDESTIYSRSTRASSNRMALRNERDILWENMDILHLAIQDNDVNIVKEFMKGTDWPQLQGHDPQGRTLLHWAMAFGNNEVARLILTHPSTSKRTINFHDKNGRTALHYASMAGRNDLVKILFMKGAKINQKDRQGMTPLHYSAQSTNPFLIHTLLARGADKYMRDKSQRLPYHIALAWKSSSDVVHALDPDVPNDKARQEFIRKSYESGPIPISYYDQDLSQDTRLMRLPSFMSRLFGKKLESPMNVARIPLKLLGILSQGTIQRRSKQPQPNQGEQLVEVVKLEMEKDAQKATVALLRKFHVGVLERYKVMNALTEEEAELRQNALEALIMRHKQRIHEHKIKRKKEKERLKKIHAQRYRIPHSQSKVSKVPLKMIKLRKHGGGLREDDDREDLLAQLDKLNQLAVIPTVEEPLSPNSDNAGKAAQNQTQNKGVPALQYKPCAASSRHDRDHHQYQPRRDFSVRAVSPSGSDYSLGLKRKHHYNMFAQDDIGVRYSNHNDWRQRGNPTFPSKKRQRRFNKPRNRGVHFPSDRTIETAKAGYDSDSSPTFQHKRHKIWTTYSKRPYDQSADASIQSSHAHAPMTRKIYNRNPYPAQGQGTGMYLTGEPIFSHSGNQYLARPITSAGQWGFLPTSTRNRGSVGMLKPLNLYSQQQYSSPAYQRAWKSSPPPLYQQAWKASSPPPYDQAGKERTPTTTAYKHQRSNNTQHDHYSHGRSPVNYDSRQYQMGALQYSISRNDRKQLQMYRPSEQASGIPPQNPRYNTKGKAWREDSRSRNGDPILSNDSQNGYFRNYPRKDFPRGFSPQMNYSREYYPRQDYYERQIFTNYGPRTPFQFQAIAESFPSSRPAPQNRPLGLVAWAKKAFPNLVGKNKLVSSLGKLKPASATTRGNDRGYYGIRDRRKKLKARKKYKYFFLRNAKCPVAPQRRALTEFVGNSDRFNYVNSPKFRVHQCLDFEKLHKQWL